MSIKILHTADWHLGTFKSPEVNGINLRTEDTKRCLDELLRVAKEQRPDIVTFSGDMFHVGLSWSNRCCEEIVTAAGYITELSKVSGNVVIMRGTPNHDGEGQFKVLREIFTHIPNVYVVDSPMVVKLEDVDIAVLPGFDRGVFRAKFPGISKEEENEIFTNELSNIVMGLKSQCDPLNKSVLMSHYTIPGANTESGQIMMLNQFEPVIPRETLLAADFDLVALGHIHRPQQLVGLKNTYYSGAINALNFNDEGQERGFWLYIFDELLGDIHSEFCETPIRKFKTIELNDDDIQMINEGNIKEVAMRNWIFADGDGDIKDKIVRVHYECSADHNKALNKKMLEKALLDDGAFMVSEILPQKVVEAANREVLNETTDPETNLRNYLEEKQLSEDKIENLVSRARPVIAKAEADMTSVMHNGAFIPVEISVNNYRNYAEETFNFDDISFCTINGQNGAGKSSLFMDAIIDCLYEEPREGEKTGWIRNDESARSGSISFTFKIGDKTYRVVRTRTKSGRPTLNVSEYVLGQWEDRSREKVIDTQQEILNIVGMDSMTFKSCALIMQDQYGLFLQAKPEERVEVLGTLLGLSVYQSMEKICADYAKESGSKNKALMQEIGIKETEITNLGNPDVEIYERQKRLNETELSLEIKTKKRDDYNLALTAQAEAMNRAVKLKQELANLTNKKLSVLQAMNKQSKIVQSASVVLEQKSMIEDKVKEYNDMLLLVNESKGKAVLYTQKQQEGLELAQKLEDIIKQIKRIENNLKAEQDKKSALAMPVDESELRDNVAQYEKFTELVRNLTNLRMTWITDSADVERKRYSLVSKQQTVKQELQRKDQIRNDLLKRIALMQESGCSNTDNATCKFLEDARNAQEEYPLIEAEIEEYQSVQQREIETLMEELSNAEQKLNENEFSQEKLTEYQTKVQMYKDAPEQLKKFEDREHQMELISMNISHLASSLEVLHEQENEMKCKISDNETEISEYRDAFERYSELKMKLEELALWEDKAKEIPLATERHQTASERLTELFEELEELKKSISEKEIEAQNEEAKAGNIEELKMKVRKYNLEISGLQAVIRDKQEKIGALKQKQETIKRLVSEAQLLRKEQMEYASENADYEMLKVAFSQSGVPHQIIRSIIPQFTATANSILGQMTGGKMGVEFRLEKLQKNGKEKTSLDIFIEEYGKTALPYLSKSGGEKVKSSLSVILALSEIKSSSAGVQLGMLFIDEPPFLDSDGVQAYCDSLETIQNRYKDIKIMAITHDPTMKERFTQSVDVIKPEHGSKVIY